MLENGKLPVPLFNLGSLKLVLHVQAHDFVDRAAQPAVEWTNLLKPSFIRNSHMLHVLMFPRPLLAPSNQHY